MASDLQDDAGEGFVHVWRGEMASGLGYPWVPGSWGGVVRVASGRLELGACSALQEEENRQGITMPSPQPSAGSSCTQVPSTGGPASTAIHLRSIVLQRRKRKTTLEHLRTKTVSFFPKVSCFKVSSSH